jgi:hypothetical protein
MFAKIGGAVALVLAVGLYLAVPAAQAKTFKGTFKTTGETVGIFSDFSFDGSTINAAGLNTFFGTDSLGDVGPGQGGERSQHRRYKTLQLQGTLRLN